MHTDLLNADVFYLFVYFLGDMGGFIRKQRPDEAIKPEFFYARFDDKWASWRNVIGQRA